MANERPHLSPRFIGPRFEKHSIPVELLPDLLAYRDLIREVAKELFKRADPTRKRVPRGFEAAFRLSLKDVGEGSAVAQMVNDVSEDYNAEIIEFAPYFERAKAAVDETIKSATVAGDGKIPADFPVRLLTNFGKIGKNLKEGESIDFGYAGEQSEKVRYTDAVRRALVLFGSDEIEGLIDIVGRVTGIINDPEPRFTIKVDGASVVSGPYESGSQDDIIKAFRQKATHSLRVRGSGVYDRQNIVLRILEAKDLELLDEREVQTLKASKRIDEMTKLPSRWCNGAGEPLSKEAADWAVGILREVLAESSVPVPYVYPSPSGEVQFEWRAEGAALDVRANPTTKRAELSAYGQDWDEDKDFDLGADQINALREAVANLVLRLNSHSN